jgi:hypothetical protein
MTIVCKVWAWWPALGRGLLWAGCWLSPGWAGGLLLPGIAHAATTADPAAEAPAAIQSAAQQLDALLAREVYLKHPKSEPAPMVGDEAFLRRATLDLIGIRPSPADMALFLLDPSADRRQSLVDRLLADPRFGRNWGRYWRDVVMYRRSEDRALLASASLESFLTESLNKNLGWDRVAQAMIAATGNVAESGPTGLIVAQAANADDVASEVSRIFLGIQIQCAQCHDHPTDRWKREEFHEFAAFFPRLQLRPVFKDGQMRGLEVVSLDFEPRFRRPAMAGRGSLEHFMPDLKDPNGKGKLMTPAFFATGRKLRTGSSDRERRTSVSQWITSRDDGWFAKAFVNRVWAELTGEGFYEPVDDLGPGRPCAAPETLNYLAGQFAAHAYDVKWLYRTIAATSLYARQCRPRRNATQAPFLANCAQPLRGDQLFDILLTSLQVDLQGMAFNRGSGPYARFGGPRFQFDTVFGYDPSQRRDEISGSIPQALTLMNSQLVNRALDGRNPSTMLGQLISQFKNDDLVVSELYLRCLARDPTERELAVARDHVRSVGERAEALEDILWGIVNRTEFIQRN